MAQTDKQHQMEQMRQMVEQRSWVRTPWKYTRLGGGLSLVQQQALLMVSEHLQGYIRRFYELNLDKVKESPKSLFSEHVLREGIPPFRIYLQDLGVQPSHYDAARKAIDEINLQVEYTVTDADGKPTNKTELANVFSKFGFETTGDYYHYTDKDGNRKPVAMQRPYIDVKINPDVAMWAFNMNEGYVNHLKMIAMYSTKRPTPRIYLLLMRELKKDQQQADIRIPLGQLKEYLGIRPYYDKEKKQMVTPYPMFRSFKQKVLDAVQQDIARMASEVPQQTDITFTWEPVYPGSRKKGDPEAILFHVSRTLLGTAYSVIVNHKPIKAVQQEIDFGDADQTAPHSLTKEQVETANRACYQSIRTEMNLTGNDVWFLSYDAPTHTVTYSYDRQRPELYDKLIGSSRFLSIIHSHFGNEISVKLRASGV